jgi:hypothetical protein
MASRSMAFILCSPAISSDRCSRTHAELAAAWPANLPDCRFIAELSGVCRTVQSSHALSDGRW